MKIPTLSQNTNPALRRVDRMIELFILIGILSFTLLVCCSCGSTKVVTQTVEHVRKDTVYLSNIQYDSIYVYQDHISEHHLGTLPPVNSKGEFLNTPMRTDTLYIKDKSIEYRYKLLRDTIRVVQRDSIPYEVTITEVKELTRPLTWYDHLTRLTFWIVISFLLSVLIRELRKLSVR